MSIDESWIELEVVEQLGCKFWTFGGEYRKFIPLIFNVNIII